MVSNGGRGSPLKPKPNIASTTTSYSPAEKRHKAVATRVSFEMETLQQPGAKMSKRALHDSQTLSLNGQTRLVVDLINTRWRYEVTDQPRAQSLRPEALCRTEVSCRGPVRQKLDVQLLALLHKVGEQLALGGLRVQARWSVAELPQMPGGDEPVACVYHDAPVGRADRMPGHAQRRECVCVCEGVVRRGGWREE